VRVRKIRLSIQIGSSIQFGTSAVVTRSGTLVYIRSGNPYSIANSWIYR
jgi:hypothetical protein